MMKDQFVVFLLYSTWDNACDYERQTVERVSKFNKVVAFYPLDAHPFYKVFTHFYYTKLFIKQITSLGRNLSLFPNIYFFPFHRYSFIKSMNERIMLSLLLGYIKIYSKVKSLAAFVWTFSPHAHGLIKSKFFLKGNVVVYDCVDYRPGKAENSLLRFASIVFANSRTLYRTLRQKHPNVHLVPQGFDGEIFIKPSPAKVLDFVKKIPRPVIGYVGSINHRIDWNLIKDLVGAFSNVSFVFVGKISDQFRPQGSSVIESTIKYLRKNPNVYFFHEFPKKTMPRIIDSFTICIIPYAANQDFNQYSFPMKTFEYLSRGKPVISSPIKELTYYSDVIHLSNSRGAWKKSIKQLLINGWSKSKRKRQLIIARRNTWEHKLEAISHELRKHLVFKHSRRASL